MSFQLDTKDDILTATCGVCGSPAAAHLHYGSVSCYSCRAFFRRGQPKQIRCIFGHGSCQISLYNRTNCKLCRYHRCLEVGMKPDKVDRFVAKRKGREANNTSTEDAWLLLNIQEPNRCPASSLFSPNALDGLRRGTINKQVLDSMTKSSEGSIKQRGNTEELLQSENMELNTFCDNMIGLFRNMQGNNNESFVRENRDMFSNTVNSPTGPAANYTEYKKDSNSSSIIGSFRNMKDSVNETQARECKNIFLPVEDTNTPVHKHNTSQHRTGLIQPCSTVTSFTMPGSSQQEAATRASHDINKYTLERRSYGRPQDGFEDEGSGKMHGDKDLSETFIKQGNKTSVITRNYHCDPMDYTETINKPEEKIEDVKEEITDLGYKSSIRNCEPYFTKPNVSRHDLSNESYCGISCLKRRHTDMNTENLRREHMPAQNYQPYRSVIQKMIKHPDHQISSKHNLADFKEAVVPRPWNCYEGELSQSYTKNESDTAKTTGDGSEGDAVEKENILKVQTKENIESKEQRNPYSANKKTLYPLKKRQRMMEIPYDTEHGINKKVLPVMAFTFEEEFRVMDYIVRIEQYQNRRFDFLNQNFHRYKELTLGFVAQTNKGMKIPFNKALEEKLFNIGLEFTIQTSHEIFDEMGMLDQEQRMNVIKSTYPALYVVMWSILEGNTREKTWMDQHMKTLHITKENHAAIKDSIQGLENVRSISLKDQERFTSPWAIDMADEEKFERTVSMVGRLLKDDIQLQALYHMLVMMKPEEKHFPKNKTDELLESVQRSLCQFIYRYLAAKDNTDLKYTKTVKTDTSSAEPGTFFCSSIMKISEDVDDLNPAQKTSLLISLVDDIHDCVDIMQNRSSLV